MLLTVIDSPFSTVSEYKLQFYVTKHIYIYNQDDDDLSSELVTVTSLWLDGQRIECQAASSSDQRTTIMKSEGFSWKSGAEAKDLLRLGSTKEVSSAAWGTVLSSNTVVEVVQPT